MSTPIQHKKAILIVLDGFGIGKSSPFNAIENAAMPFYHDLIKRYPHSQLITHGEAVGLPEGVMGNSEVGHMTMGAGRIIYQDLTRISKAVRDGDFFKNTVLLDALRKGATRSGRVHLMGLLSDAGVHSHLDHLKALISLAMDQGVPEVSIHAFMDGRDTPPDSGIKYLNDLLTHPGFSNSNTRTKVRIATLSGRYYAMDRDKRWDRVEKAYKVMTGQADEFHKDAKSSLPPAIQAIEKSYQDKKSDEFVEPVLLDKDAAIREGDSIIFYNYRSDRAREISEAFTAKDFSSFSRPTPLKLSSYVGMTQYDPNLNLPFAYGPQNLNHIMGEWLEIKKLKQFRIAETEKYAHVTFFFNGGREKPFEGEERTLIPSPKEVATYDLKPEMSAFEVAKEAAERILTQKYDFVLMNFANADMVGHTGNYEAAVKAVQALDQCLSQVIGAAEKSGYHTLLTADHGNAEEMVDSCGKIHTQHTLNPVPAVWIAPGSAIAPKKDRIALNDGTLEDVMPTLCDLMGLPLPIEVTGKSLIPA